MGLWVYEVISFYLVHKFMNFFAECLSSWGGLFTSLKVHRHVRYYRTRVGKDSFHVEGNKKVMRVFAPAPSLRLVHHKWPNALL